MAEGKWISDLSADTPLVNAARRVLTVRLQVVHDQLPLALEKWKDDPEHIHQLRVGTRRAGAALAIFGDCLPRKAFKRMRNKLRTLRRAAGQARDWDVFGEALAKRESKVTATQRPGLDFLLGYTTGRRVAAQEALQSAAAGSPFNFERLSAETLAALRESTASPPPHVLGELARPWVSNLVRELHAAASENLDKYEHLHRVRILGKRLRYGMEVFADCFDSSFRERDYPLIEEMQEILGHANDSHVAGQRLTMLRELLRATKPMDWKRFRACIEGLLRYHQRRLPQQRKLFVKWWTKWQVSMLHSQGLDHVATATS
jgi:CHAD domain-containing protein